MTSDEPLVSVILCTYNAESFIRPTVQSVLDQTFENLEILILDNDSDDQTVARIKSFQDNRICLFQKEMNLGPYRGLNYLIERTSGDYVAVQDHDDIWHERKIELQINCLESNPEYVGVGGKTIKYFEGKNKVSLPEVGVNNPLESVPHTTLMFRNDGYFYDPSVGYKTDLYFMEETLCADGPVLYQLDKPLHISFVRADSQNLSFKWTAGVPWNVLDYYRRTGNVKRLLWGLLMSMLPISIAQRFKRYLFGYNLKPVSILEEDEFTKSYTKYLSVYSNEF